ncbi:hypothetical protein AAV94_04805 [Lampropedia cohaerens]|uniref:Uncharacterized protein n=1 Tax=Lampropedia cohaerens TaxID=1610491 RepID=A0A0U1Q100_9BURK|nr:hypothetical protein AAV94_04805 [Lampropedia cohaerens]
MAARHLQRARTDLQHARDSSACHECEAVAAPQRRGADAAPRAPAGSRQCLAVMRNSCSTMAVYLPLQEEEGSVTGMMNAQGV